MKNKILAIIGGTVALFGLGYLIYVVLDFRSHDPSAFTKLDLPPIILMEVLYATLLTIIFSKWAQIKTFATGAQVGLIIGAFIGACAELELFATTEYTDLSGVILGAVTFGVRFAVAGGVVAWFLGRD